MQLSCTLRKQNPRTTTMNEYIEEILRTQNLLLKMNFENLCQLYFHESTTNDSATLIARKFTFLNLQVHHNNGIICISNHSKIWTKITFSKKKIFPPKLPFCYTHAEIHHHFLNTVNLPSIFCRWMMF
jgi:hypothetical protein